MNILQRLDNGRAETHLRIVDEIVHPHYTHAKEHITDTRPAWHENKVRYRRFLASRMMRGEIKTIDGVEICRKKTGDTWFVAGNEVKFECVAPAIADALDASAATGEPPKPFFKLNKMQKRILRYWLECQRIGGPPYLAEAARALGSSTLYMYERIVAMVEWNIMYQDSGRGGQTKELWWVNPERVALINLED